jgi:pimeloyl-ACP methyl ester carboxylesterase
MAVVPLSAACERIVNATGVSIAVTEFPAPGQPPLVLLHGIGSRGASWWPVIDALAERFHLYVLDLRGHGASGSPERGYVVEDYAADLDAVLDALAIAEPRILGHSLGALVTLAWAGQHPTRARALVLEDPPLTTPRDASAMFDGWQQLAAMTPEAAAAWYQEQYPEWTEEDCRRRAETITSTAPGVWAEMRATAKEALITGTDDRFQVLTEVRCPALLLRGNPALGGVVAPEDAERLTRIMPRVRQVYFADVGHSLHREATTAFLDEVIAFLEDRR